ncbi:hypothetical protein [Pantoea sp. aB]|uniref:hypothetical protein n=1 Tax=Pantoea sp. aB TaxID=517433 RepID=UPI0001E0D7A0|nr:hypothetical protein [Pantoea sp. aB]EFM18769.1 hypothetical protein PanABDRAFT_3246 [Pantoea sp. aB]
MPSIPHGGERLFAAPEMALSLLNTLCGMSPSGWAIRCHSGYFRKILKKARQFNLNLAY